MRQMISGLIATVALATVSVAPAMACGGGGWFQSCSPCGGQAYVSPCSQGYYGGGYQHSPYYGAAYERLPEPSPQYYYVNQGPTYGGPGNFAPYPTYQESAVSGWGAYRNADFYYGYDGGRYANANHHYYDGAGFRGPAIYSYGSHSRRAWRARTNYGVSVMPGVRYGHAPRRGIRYGYAPRGMRYGAMHMGHRQTVLRRRY